MSQSLNRRQFVNRSLVAAGVMGLSGTATGGDFLA